MVVVTGATGFIGTHLLKSCKTFLQTVSLRDSDWPQKIISLSPSAIIHLAGYTDSRGLANEIWKINVGGTIALADIAFRSGARRIVFVSSIQALAETTHSNTRLQPDATPAPKTAYGRSKLDAENVLRRLSMESRMEVVIIRPPLVYGPGVKANFRNLLQLADKGIPHPIEVLNHNRRSFVAVSNLIDLILLCLEHPAAANQAFHVSDDDDISTAELLRRMGKALGKPARNIPMPQALLKTGLRLVGKGEWVDKLCGDLRVDISETKRLLGWEPKVTMEEELERTAKWWRSR